MDFIKKYTSHEEYEVNKTPNVSLCIEDNETKHLHYTKKRFDDEYLAFEALESGTFTMTIGSAVTTGDVVSVSYSLDNGETWTTTNNVQGQQVVITTPTVNAGDEVLWKGNAVRMANYYGTNRYTSFSSTANFNARGNIMSLLYGDEFKGKVSLSGRGSCFVCLFIDNTNLINTKNISLPATTLADACYQYMFDGCTSLATAPELPATTLTQSCYSSMFLGCSSLTTAPELPATTLANYCYYQMFAGCTSLTTAPELPATTLTRDCYYSMFRDCTSLTTAPVLPAKTLATNCYYQMFNGCANLTVVPELPATTLARDCYYSMFRGCTSLTTAPELPATTLTQYCYQYMFLGCTSLTTAPELPATALAESCYSGIFEGCKSLTVAPELPATTLAKSCYQSMFNGCANLTVVPELPVETLTYNCYQNMFRDCTSLTTAPQLPATTLEGNCYYQMFYGCTSLTTAPALPSTTLTDGCYYGMFNGCTSLNSITCLATDISASNCTRNWVSGVASSGTFTKDDGMNDWTRGSNGIPTNWTVEDFYATKYFTTIARENGTISFNIWKNMGTDMIASISYSTDNGETWTTTNNTNDKSEHLVITVNINEGDKVMWKSDATQLGYYDEVMDESFGSFFSSTCEFDAQGNVMSLLYGDNFKDKTTIGNEDEFAYLFSDYNGVKTCKVVNAKNLSLPATTLIQSCYSYMFNDCTSLTTAPSVLPATTLAQSCYFGMFRGCTSLTTAPELPATTLVSSCYGSMFYGCTSLTTAPELPATTLATNCYSYMFAYCTSLTTAPSVLSATTLAHSCYIGMFEGCTSLTVAPELPATTLAQNCYVLMFSGCTSLNSITCLATDISATDCTTNWVNGVASSGTFVKNESMNSWTTGTNGIPTNWAVRDYGIISTSLVMYVDDFPEDRMDGESKETVMTRQLNSSDECNIGNKYVYTGGTITYNGNTYYLWEMSDDCGISSNVAYLLTTTDNFNTLYRQSLKNNLTNHFTSLVGRLDEDKENMYNDGEIGDENELYIVKVVNNNPISLRIWVDDFPEGAAYEEGSAQDKMTAEVEDPEGEGANPYEYLGETIVYNGNTYYLWQAVEGYNIDNSMTRYFATTTIDFNTLYSQSLEDDLTNHFTDAIGMFDDSKDIYWAQSIGDDGELYLVKVEDLS